MKSSFLTPPHWIGTDIDDKKWVCIGLNIRGEFMEFTVENEVFDLTKFNLEVTNIGDRIELITGAYYDGSKLSPNWVDNYKEQGFQFFPQLPILMNALAGGAMKITVSLMLSRF